MPISIQRAEASGSGRATRRRLIENHRDVQGKYADGHPDTSGASVLHARPESREKPPTDGHVYVRWEGQRVGRYLDECLNVSSLHGDSKAELTGHIAAFTLDRGWEAGKPAYRHVQVVLHIDRYSTSR
jgi:hypothetical protein